jgi:hypothetical protein
MEALKVMNNESAGSKEMRKDNESMLKAIGALQTQSQEITGSVSPETAILSAFKRQHRGEP